MDKAIIRIKTKFVQDNESLSYQESTVFINFQIFVNSFKKLEELVFSLFLNYFKWKMSFNPDKNKQAQEVVFSRKQSKPKYPQLLFNKTPLLILPTKSTLILDDFR